MAALTIFLTPLLAARPAAAADPRAPVLRLQAGLTAAISDSALAALADACFDLRRTAHDILAGIPGADDEAERRLAIALRLRLVFELRRRPPAPPELAWIEDRQIGTGEWLLLTRVPAAGGEARILGWRVSDGPAGPRIIDVLQDGVSGTRTRRAEFGGIARHIGLAAALAAEEAAAARLGAGAGGTTTN